MPDHRPPRVVFVATDCTDANVIKRIRSFQNEGFDVISFTFRRLRYNRDFKPDWPNVDLGTLDDRAYLRRFARIVAGLFRIVRQRAKLASADFVYAKHLDAALLSWLAMLLSAAPRRFVYEVADVQPLFTRSDLAGRLARCLERLILRRTHLLVATSPGFVDNYFLPIQGLRIPSFILENKLYPPVPEPFARAGAPAGPPWRIGYFGTLRCQRSWAMIKTLAQARPESLRFVLRGRSAQIDMHDLARTSSEVENIDYGGEYRSPDDLADLYGCVDIAWCFDFQFEHHNSRWLLPNRFYDSGFFGVPMLAARNTTTGDLVEELGLGWTFDEPYLDSLSEFFDRLDPSEFREVADRNRLVPRSRFMTADDFSEMCRRILGHHDAT